jgi:SAM-dependent methyltransferase
MKFAQIIRAAAKTGKSYGVVAAVGHVFDHVRVSRAERLECFDERHGTNTDGKAYAWEFPELRGKAAADGIHPYEAVPAWMLRKIISSLPIRHRDFTFVDLGSGKGRALLVASEFSFRKLVGVEISRDLHEIAHANVGRRMTISESRPDCDLRCMDVSNYEFTEGPQVVFLFNPFGKSTLDKVVSRLEGVLRTSHREIIVIYANPRFERRFFRSPFFKRVEKKGSRLRPWRRYVVYHSKNRLN